MSFQGQPLEVTVIGCSKLRDKEWFSRQDPYVVLEYAGTKYRTKTDTDGGKNPSFNEKFMLPLIEGLHEIHVTVWNSNTISTDDFIGSGKILLQKVLTDGYDDNTWPLASKNGRRSGEMRLIMHYAGPKGMQHSRPPTSQSTAGCVCYPPYAQPYSHAGSLSHGSYPPQDTAPYGGCPTPSGYATQPPYGYQPPYAQYPAQPYPQQYPQASPSGYPPQGNPYPPLGYPSQHGQPPSGFYPHS